MRSSDFFFESPAIGEGHIDADPWTTVIKFDDALIKSLRREPPDGEDDVSVAIGLAHLIHEELERYGTVGNVRLDDGEIQSAFLSLRIVLKRLQIGFAPPFRNFTTFGSHWRAQGATGTGSWDARRRLLDIHFAPLHIQLMLLEEEHALKEPTEAVLAGSARPWPLVDEELRELRRRFRSAVTSQDYRAVGGHCVGVLEALSKAVYNAADHLRPGETEPPVDKTKQRLGRYVEVSLAGNQNEELRRITNAAIELAQAVKHRPTGTRRDAGIATNSVILLVAIFEQLDERG